MKSDISDTKELKRQVAKLMIDVILGKIRVLDALKSFPKDTEDKTISTCFHILVHFESDEDLRKNDPLYKETQDEFMVNVAETLLKGQDLPPNIIAEYGEFYESDLIYRPNTKENIFKRLKRIINL